MPVQKTILDSLFRLLPSVFKRLPYAQWPNHLRGFLQLLSQTDGIMERQPVFALLIIPKHRRSTLLLKLRFTPPHVPNCATTYTFVRNCPGGSLTGILSEGFLRPMDWRNAQTILQLGFLLSLLLFWAWGS